METLTIVLLACIGVFAIGNILLYLLERKAKATKLPLGDAKEEVLSSKIDVLNKRVSRLEQNETGKAETNVVRAIVKQKKQTTYPITKYKRKKKKLK